MTLTVNKKALTEIRAKDGKTTRGEANACALANFKCTLGATRLQGPAHMFEDLINFDPEVESTPTGFVSLEKTAPTATVDAKVKTANWLKDLGAADSDKIITDVETSAARNAFANLVSASPEDITHTALAQIKTPEAVQHLVGMLTAYDWEFINQARELRGYTVAKLVEETQNPSANIRLKALGLLGKVTEIGLFTDKVEIKKTELSDMELEQRIKEKLNRFAQIVEVTDVIDIDTMLEKNANHIVDDDSADA